MLSDRDEIYAVTPRFDSETLLPNLVLYSALYSLYSINMFSWTMVLLHFFFLWLWFTLGVFILLASCIILLAIKRLKQGNSWEPAGMGGGNKAAL